MEQPLRKLSAQSACSTWLDFQETPEEGMSSSQACRGSSGRCSIAKGGSEGWSRGAQMLARHVSRLTRLQIKARLISSTKGSLPLLERDQRMVLILVLSPYSRARGVVEPKTSQLACHGQVKLHPVRRTTCM